MGVEGTCSPRHPLVLPVGGPQYGEDEQSLVFTPEYPCGVELNTSLANPRRLVKLAPWVGCVGERDERVVISASVQKLDSTRGPGQIAAVHVGSCEGDAVEPRLKLRVMACGYAAPVWIDADSDLVVSAGPIEIDLFGPGGEAGVREPWRVYGRRVLAFEEEWTDVQVKIVACRADGYMPEGTLSEWLRNVDVPANPEDAIVLLRPRRARRLRINASTIAGATSNVSVRFLQESVAGSAPLGFATFQGGFSNASGVDIPGSCTAIEIVPTAPTNVFVRWGIQ